MYLITRSLNALKAFLNYRRNKFPNESVQGTREIAYQIDNVTIHRCHKDRLYLGATVNKH